MFVKSLALFGGGFETVLRCSYLQQSYLVKNKFDWTYVVVSLPLVIGEDSPDKARDVGGGTVGESKDAVAAVASTEVPKDSIPAVTGADESAAKDIELLGCKVANKKIVLGVHGY